MKDDNKIKILWNQINNKTDFLIKLSIENGRVVNTLRNHWFSKASNYGVPKDELLKTIIFMEKYIEKN